jgi:hypothetical protein
VSVENNDQEAKQLPSGRRDQDHAKDLGEM